jgi:hypothetical protein
MPGSTTFVVTDGVTAASHGSVANPLELSAQLKLTRVIRSAPKLFQMHTPTTNDNYLSPY